jgi:hypothetical protein
VVARGGESLQPGREFVRTRRELRQETTPIAIRIALRVVAGKQALHACLGCVGKAILPGLRFFSFMRLLLHPSPEQERLATIGAAHVAHHEVQTHSHPLS